MSPLLSVFVQHICLCVEQEHKPLPVRKKQLPTSEHLSTIPIVPCQESSRADVDTHSTVERSEILGSAQPSLSKVSVRRHLPSF